jgi:hypothetical protein
MLPTGTEAGTSRQVDTFALHRGLPDPLCLTFIAGDLTSGRAPKSRSTTTLTDASTATRAGGYLAAATDHRIATAKLSTANGTTSRLPLVALAPTGDGD